MQAPGAGASVPAYLPRHSGPCIVAGNAWTLHDDLARAWTLYPDAPVIAINGASNAVRAIALFSAHPERFMERGFEWIRRQRKFGGGFTVHGATERPGCPWVQHWWPQISGSGGGSVWGGRKLARLIGFDLAILCGAPLQAGNYEGPWLPGQMADDAVCRRYADEIAADTDWHEGALSMSGRTMEILGSPQNGDPRPSAG